MWRLSNLFKLVLLLFIAYLGSSELIQKSNTAAYERMFMGAKPTSVNLIIAHPDDEVMFFAPTLIQLDALLDQEVPVRVFCMTNGGADGLGAIRVRELQESLQLLMHRKRPNTEILDFADGMQENWDLKSTTKHLKSVVTDSAPTFITFDDHGISNHINHISCYKTVQNLRDYYPEGLYFRLSSKQWILQKYTAFIPALLHAHRSTRGIIFVNDFKTYLLSFATMLNAHVSQMVWFRYGWWFLSYYVYANELQRF
ncbi:LAFA_0E21330g1_1 [Lachancea sp. 'fantastica']|nr:LAFA_0E21330g1_1 [Lachancea sp. 'fantastica']